MLIIGLENTKVKKCHPREDGDPVYNYIIKNK